MRIVFAAVAALFSLVACERGTSVAPQPPRAPAASTLQETLAQLAANGEALKDVPFPIVVEGTTGRKVLPVNPGDAVVAEIVAAVEQSVRAAVGTLSAETSPVRELRRINEASHFFEDAIMAHLNARNDLACEIPRAADGGSRRSGYPDLKITHKPSGRIAYLDPKLFETGSRDSTFRTFYYEPKTNTNKILDDAHHLLVGIEHDGNEGAWKFSSWHLVDLSKLSVRLKPEFQASNRDVYREDATISSGER